MQPVPYETLYLIPLLPLVGAAILCLFGHRMSRDLISVVALSTVLGAFAVTLLATYHMVRVNAPLEDLLYHWISVGRFRFDLILGLDRLSASLMLVVTGVGFLIH